jgi:actin-like ATPase involved in cell morphogenesis
MKAKVSGGYVLGVDLGTTYSAASVGRAGSVMAANLGTHTTVIPSVVAIGDDGRILVGEPAALRGRVEPDRAARYFKRRIGDEIPVVLGGTPYGAEALTGHLLSTIIETVSQQEGESPSRVVLTHPANWQAFKLALLEASAQVAGLKEIGTLSEPEASAIAHRARDASVKADSILAVYDLGGGTFDVALVRRTGRTFSPLGSPAGIERLGGLDFDEAVRQHVADAIGGIAPGSGTTNFGSQRSLEALRSDCQYAKEFLSSNTDAIIPVILPDTHTEVRLTRNEFESMIRPRILETVSVLSQVIKDAGLKAQDVDAVLLVGGSSAIPLIADSIQEITGIRTMLGPHPKLAASAGAAWWGMDTSLDHSGVLRRFGSDTGEDRRTRATRRAHRKEKPAATDLVGVALLADKDATISTHGTDGQTTARGVAQSEAQLHERDSPATGAATDADDAPDDQDPNAVATPGTGSRAPSSRLRYMAAAAVTLMVAIIVGVLLIANAPARHAALLTTSNGHRAGGSAGSNPTFSTRKRTVASHASRTSTPSISQGSTPFQGSAGGVTNSPVTVTVTVTQPLSSAHHVKSGTGTTGTTSPGIVTLEPRALTLRPGGSGNVVLTNTTATGVGYSWQYDPSSSLLGEMVPIYPGPDGNFMGGVVGKSNGTGTTFTFTARVQAGATTAGVINLLVGYLDPFTGTNVHVSIPITIEI